MSYVIRVSIPHVFASQLHTETLPNQESNLGKVPSQMEQACMSQPFHGRNSPVWLCWVCWGSPQFSEEKISREIFGKLEFSEQNRKSREILGNLGKLEWNGMNIPVFCCFLWLNPPSRTSPLEPVPPRPLCSMPASAKCHPENEFDRGKDVNWNTQFIVAYSGRWDDSSWDDWWKWYSWVNVCGNLVPSNVEKYYSMYF